VPRPLLLDAHPHTHTPGERLLAGLAVSLAGLALFTLVLTVRAIVQTVRLRERPS